MPRARRRRRQFRIPGLAGRLTGWRRGALNRRVLGALYDLRRGEAVIHRGIPLAGAGLLFVAHKKGWTQRTGIP
ncbi:hypothetical protein SBA1_480034 [Candidatus Sulfotelmatobacter kueseliae]|uniref:Uncharacterized protein n=1 Tax=Candidatus Sulfotelmatobacter kueseliae TaxID=2042962 RepID=A0A2U3KU29_9BACT|nr:hypothetical protein SBA1_480034 [Candidatus Sulfotelmatobacter kueseliae]